MRLVRSNLFKPNETSCLYYFSKGLAQFGAWLLFKIRHYGAHYIPEDGGFILASNHQSYLDPIFVGLGSKRPLHFMTRSSAFDIPVVGLLIQQLNAFPVDRGQADIRAIRKAMEVLEAGGGLLVFPEGTRTVDGSLGSFKAGVVSIAQRAACPIVPAAVRGAYEVWPRQRRFPMSGRVSVAYGQPFPPASSKSEASDTAGRLGETIRQLYEALEWRHSG